MRKKSEKSGPSVCPECEYEKRTGEASPVTHTCDPRMEHYVEDEARIRLDIERGLAWEAREKAKFERSP